MSTPSDAHYAKAVERLAATDLLAEFHAEHPGGDQAAFAAWLDDNALLEDEARRVMAREDELAQMDHDEVRAFGREYDRGHY